MFELSIKALNSKVVELNCDIKRLTFLASEKNAGVNFKQGNKTISENIEDYEEEIKKLTREISFVTEIQKVCNPESRILTSPVTNDSFIIMPFESNEYYFFPNQEINTLEIFNSTSQKYLIEWSNNNGKLTISIIEEKE